jgi:hypothetical protein
VSHSICHTQTLGDATEEQAAAQPTDNDDKVDDQVDGGGSDGDEMGDGARIDQSDVEHRDDADEGTCCVHACMCVCDVACAR